MRMESRKRRAAGLAALLLTAGLAPRPALAVEAAGPLEGRTLPIAGEVRSSLESMAGGLLGGDLKGRVVRVVVDEDRSRRLTVHVSCEGFLGARLQGELLNGERRLQAGISMAEPVEISDAASDVALTFVAEPGGTPTRSAFLRVSVIAQGRRTAGFVRVFQLGKEWAKALESDADFKVTITPRPIGRTAELGPTPTLAVPDGTVRTESAPVSSPAAPALETRSVTSAPATMARSITPPVSPRTAQTDVRKSAANLKEAVQHFRVGLLPADANRGARGPAALPLRPFAGLRTEDINLDLSRVVNVFPEVYPDQEASSGIFYFLPRGYALEWQEGEGYGFKSIYSAAAPGQQGQVMMAARLDGGIGPRDLDVASKVVEAHVRARGMTFRELRALPIDTLAISLSDDLGRYSIPPDRISVNGLSDVTGQLDVSWVTDERTKDFIQEALVENVGIHGSVTYAPTGGGLGLRTVPIRMLLGDDATFGPIRWDRTGWRNGTPYPVTLRYLHALRVSAGAPPVVHSWSLGETRVPPGGQVRWSAAGVPAWLDGQAQKMWVDYTVERSCKACGVAALAALTGGVSQAGASQITFRSLTPLAETGAHDILVEVRSRYFDPRGEQMQTRSVVLDADDREFLVGPLYLGDPSASGDESIFEFRLSLTMSDGQTHTGRAAWIPGTALRVPIGRHQLERSIGALPPR